MVTCVLRILLSNAMIFRIEMHLRILGGKEKNLPGVRKR